MLLRMQFARTAVLPGLVVMVCACAGLAFQNQGTTARTPEQIESVHSHLFSGGGDKTIHELLASSTGDLHITYSYRPGLGPGCSDKAGSPPCLLLNWTCSSDLVIVGIAGSATSHRTSDDRFLYSDWQFLVTEVIKNDSKAPVRVESALTVVRPGGKLKIGDRTVYATEGNFRDFQDGEEYLLFLSAIRQTGAYQASAEHGFAFFGNRPVRLTHNSYYASLEAKDREALLKDTRAAATTTANWPGCSRQGK